MAGELFDLELLDDEDPFEIAEQAAHLFKRPMTEPKKMTPQQEHDFYAQPENQVPDGPARRRREKLSEMVPVRFPPDVTSEVRRRADKDDRSESSWIRRAVEHELERDAR